jgi:hypothetical protein
VQLEQAVLRDSTGTRQVQNIASVSKMVVVWVSGIIGLLLA